jgi:hypothetical protein
MTPSNIRFIGLALLLCWGAFSVVSSLTKPVDPEAEAKRNQEFVRMTGGYADPALCDLMRDRYNAGQATWAQYMRGCQTKQEAQNEHDLAVSGRLTK